MCRAFLIVPVVASMCACAGVKYQPDPDGQWFPPKGFRYYEPAWFVMGYVKGNGDVVTKAMVLPDQTKRMSAQPYALMADTDSTMEFKDGILVSSVERGDATAVPKAIIAAAKQVVSAYLKSQVPVVPGVADIPEVESLKIRGPYLFKLIPSGDGKGVILLGDRGQVLDVANPNRTPVSQSSNEQSGSNNSASNKDAGSSTNEANG